MPTASNLAAVLARPDQLTDEGVNVPREDQFQVRSAPMTAWGARATAFLLRTFGESDTYTVAFGKATDGEYLSDRDRGVALLQNLRGDVEGGYLANYYLGVAGDILTDLLDLAAWSLAEGSKEAGAILAGSALELGLKRIADARSVDISTAKGIDDVNAALAKAVVYPKVRQSQIDAWRVLRNHAIHGEHTAYSDAEVRLMLDGIRAFFVDFLT